MGNSSASHAPEARERAVRMVDDHGSRWAAIQSIASKIGRMAETRIR